MVTLKPVLLLAASSDIIPAVRADDGPVATTCSRSSTTSTAATADIKLHATSTGSGQLLASSITDIAGQFTK